MSRHNNVAISIEASQRITGQWDAGYVSTDGTHVGQVDCIQHRSNVVKECIRELSEVSGIPRSRVRIKEVNYQ